MPSEGVGRFSQDIRCSFRAFVTRKKERERTQNPIDSLNDLLLSVAPCTAVVSCSQINKIKVGLPFGDKLGEAASTCFQLADMFETFEVASLPRPERNMRIMRFMTRVPATYFEIPNFRANKQFLRNLELL